MQRLDLIAAGQSSTAMRTIFLGEGEVSYQGSYQPIFAVAAVAYLVALAVIHLLVPRYRPAAAVAVAER